ncbi:extracellular matrix/biofilm biosynthesis regulator RemA family protein [Treponema sp. R6D11]
MKLLPIGYANYLSEDRVISVITPDTLPTKRLIASARKNKTLVDATCGRKTRAVFVMDTGHIVLSAVKLATLANRLDKNIKLDATSKEEE